MNTQFVKCVSYAYAYAYAGVELKRMSHHGLGLPSQATIPDQTRFDPALLTADPLFLQED